MKKRYDFTDEEKDVLNKFQYFSIPFIFSSGEYSGYLQYFDLAQFVCWDILKGAPIDECFYQMTLEYDDTAVPIEKLNSRDLEFLNLYYRFEDILKKYHVAKESTIAKWRELRRIHFGACRH